MEAFIYAYACMFLCLYSFTSVYMCLCTYICMYIRTYVCMYVHMYVYKYMHLSSLFLGKKGAVLRSTKGAAMPENNKIESFNYDV
jgi:hypothetical protein